MDRLGKPTDDLLRLERIIFGLGKGAVQGSVGGDDVEDFLPGLLIYGLICQ
jgi:hypothetical protein